MVHTAVLAAATLAAAAGSEHRYVTHIAAGLADEPHVFVETAPGADFVHRPTSATPRGSKLFAAREGTRIPFAEFFDPERRYPKGSPLSLTLGEWLGATGVTRATCRRGGATLSSRFRGLLPRGVYSLVDVRLDAQGIPQRFSPLGGGRRNAHRVAVDRRGHGAHRISLPFCPARVRDPKMFVALVLHFDRRIDRRAQGREPTGTRSGVQLFTPLKG